eukprot:scaffold115_cov172-Amphora_coffeaeformis.AAC.1
MSKALAENRPSSTLVQNVDLGLYHLKCSASESVFGVLSVMSVEQVCLEDPSPHRLLTSSLTPFLTALPAVEAV